MHEQKQIALVTGGGRGLGRRIALRLAEDGADVAIIGPEQKELDQTERELQQLDQLISQLLEVGRLDAIGHFAEPEDISIEPLLRQCAKIVCANHQHSENDVFSFDVAPAVVNARRLILEMIFSNLLDNAVKYAGDPPKVDVSVQVRD